MKYVTLSDMARTIRANMWKIPHDIDFVVGVPRSGVMCGSIIAEFLNAPLIDVNSFVHGAAPTGGCRLRFHSKSARAVPRVLVVDDTVSTGGQLRMAKGKLAHLAGQYEFIYCVVYREGQGEGADIWLEDVRQYTGGRIPFVLYEWNIFHHGDTVMGQSLYDIDGVFCVNPPDERTGQQYLDYIANATPLFTPTNKVGGIVSYRLARNEDITRRWLDAQGIRYGSLTLFPAQTYEARAASGIGPSAFKARIYNEATWAALFVESEEGQARRIHDLTGKPVLCVATNELYA